MSEMFQRLWRQEFSAGGGLFTRIFSQRLGAVIAYCGLFAGVSPNLLTAFALGASLAGSVLFAFGASGLEVTLTSALLYQLAYGFDCSDGQLARASKRSSKFGGWLDVMADLIALLVMAFSILYWLIANIDGPVWLACAGPLFLAIGRVLILYSSKFTEGTGRGKRPGYGGGFIKQFLWLIIDTPTLLLVACLLRDYPEALNLYLLIMGIVYCLNAIYLGYNRLYRQEVLEAG